MDAEPRTRRIYVLKQLQTRQIWAGSKAHDCIKHALHNLRRGIEPMKEKEAIEMTLAVMRKDFASSRRGDYWKNPKSTGFFEHEYATEVPDDERHSAARAHVSRHPDLEVFLRSPDCVLVRVAVQTYQVVTWIDEVQWYQVVEPAAA